MPVVSTKVAWTDKIVTALRWGDSPLNMGGSGYPTMQKDKYKDIDKQMDKIGREKETGRE